MNKHERIACLLGLSFHRIEFRGMGSGEIPSAIQEEADGRDSSGQPSSGVASPATGERSAKSDPRDDRGRGKDDSDVERDDLEQEVDEDEYEEEVLVIEIEKDELHVDESEEPAERRESTPISRPGANGNGIR